MFAGHWLGTGNTVGSTRGAWPDTGHTVNIEGSMASDNTDASTSVSMMNMEDVFAPFEEALWYARALGLKQKKDWHDWCKGGVKPHNIPFSPEIVYGASGWQGWKHWLGASKSGGFMDFYKAVSFTRLLKLKGTKARQILAAAPCAPVLPRTPPFPD